MTAIKLDQFRGINRKGAAHLIAPNQAREARNLSIGSGDFEPLRAPRFEEKLEKAGPILSLHRFADAFWFHWDKDVDVAPGPIPSDTESRTYFTGDGEPKMTYAGLATQGASKAYPINSYTLGVPAPSISLEVRATGTPEDENSIDEARVYAYCFVSEKGEPGPLSPPSEVVFVSAGQTVELSGMEAVPSGNYNITHKRIYRASATDDYFLVAEVDAASTDFTDSLATADLGPLCESAGWYPPPEDMRGLIALPNGVMAGFSKNELCLSEPFVPHAWPIEYRVSTDFPIVAIAAVGAAIIVTTTGNPYIASATHPSALTLEKMELPYACASKRSMVDLGYTAIYAGADGLVGAGQSVPQVLTSGILPTSDWRALKPSSINAYRLDDQYLGFYDNGREQGGFLFDPRTGDLVFLDLYASAGYTDPESGALYLVMNGTEVVLWSAGELLRGQWRSKRFIASRPINPAVLQVDAAAYPVRIRLWADDVLRFDREIHNRRAIRLPSGYQAEHFECEVSSTHRVRSVVIADTAEELRQL